MKIRTLKMKSTDTALSLFKECKALFPIYCCYENDLETVISKRHGDYEIQFKDCVEVKGESISANEIKERSLKGITLEERLRFEIDYFKETGEHLDLKNWTLCSDSRTASGAVPGVCFDAVFSKVFVCDFYPSNAFDGLRFRPAISLETSSLVPSDIKKRVEKLEEEIAKISKVLIY